MRLDHDNPQNILKSNQIYQAKLSWKRAQAIDLKNQIFFFIVDNFNIWLPASKEEYNSFKKENQDKDEQFNMLIEEYEELVKLHYSLTNYGLSIASLFEENGKFETYTQAHIFSKHKMDPVWNWKKSQLIRSIYRNFIQNSSIFEQTYIPVHITLTLPHSEGRYKGQRFYATELIQQFNFIRKYPKWKQFVYAGEYGIEVKKTENTKNGLHIHIHSFSLLYGNQRINDFRKWLQTTWERLTGGNQIWVETLYFFQKDESGKFITEKKVIDGQPKEFRKKFYLDKVIRQIKSSSLPVDEKRKEIQSTYLHGIMEAIKYHFKMDDLMQINSDKLYDVDLINDILINTRNKRMYSRFGAFYNEPALNFNQLESKNGNEEEETLSEATDQIVNPFTKKFTFSDETNKVVFWPEKQKRQPKHSANPYCLVNNTDASIYKDVGKGIFIKKAVSEVLKRKSSLTKLN